MLKIKGHNLIVLTAMPNYPTGNIFPEYGGIFKSETVDQIIVKRCYIFPSNSTKLLPRLLNYFSFVLSSTIIGIFSLEKVDIIMTESPPLFLGISGYILSRVKKAKLVFNVSDLWPESAVNLGVIGEGIPLKISRWLESFCYKKSRIVTGQSKEIVKNITDRFPNCEVYRLSNGVDVTTYNPEQKSDILENWSNGRRYTAVYAGLFGIAQGLEQVIDAAKVLMDHNTDLQILLVGDGPEKDKLVGLVRDKGLNNVSIVDSQDKSVMPQIWASATIGIIPLKQYIPGAVPSKLYEVMASGIPVIFIGQGEPVDIVNQSKCGLTVKPYDTTALVDSINTLLTNPDKRKIYGSNGVNEVFENYNRTKIVDSFNDYICRL